VSEVELAYRDEPDWFADRAAGLLASARDRTVSAVEAFARWDAPLTEDGARLAVARAHGADSWDGLLALVAAQAARDGGVPLGRAFAAIEASDPGALRAELDRVPSLVGARGTNGNDLLGLATGSGDERLVALLLARGADVAHANVHGWTALHQAASTGNVALTRLLLEAGAPVDGSARGDGGTPLIVALFWGKRATAELVARSPEPGGAPTDPSSPGRSATDRAPDNLRAAAGLGDLDRIAKLVDADGVLDLAAGARRGFYRPHGGFPAWRPSDDAREVRDEAVAWAARNDRADAIEALAARGANVDADVYRGTPLAWAASRGAVGAIVRLLALGADPSRRGTFGGPDHGVGATALHLAVGCGRREPIELLLAAGADPSIRDERYDATPAGWAEHFGDATALAVLREAGAA